MTELPLSRRFLILKTSLHESVNNCKLMEVAGRVDRSTITWLAGCLELELRFGKDTMRRQENKRVHRKIILSHLARI
jgi:hypothetical protein